MNALQKVEDINNSIEMAVIDQVVIQGDLSKLDPGQRVTYYNNVCKSLGLNPFTRPFDYIQLNGKLTLYAKKDATEQLRKLNGISIEKLESKLVDDLYIVTATAKTRDGRMDSATGAVTIGHLKGDAKANALMKAETKAKRRVTLSISGMGWCDETEVETIPSARHVSVDMATGELKNDIINPTPTPSYEVNTVYTSDVKPLDITISLEQARELQDLIDGCSQNVKDEMPRYILSTYKAKDLKDIPAQRFEPFKKTLTKKYNEHQKMLAEAEMTINVKAEE